MLPRIFTASPSTRRGASRGGMSHCKIKKKTSGITKEGGPRPPTALPV